MKINQKSFNPSYVGPRKDILNLVPGNVGKVLDVGCSVGALGGQIKKKFGAEVIGIELDEKMAKAARKKLDKVITGDLDEINLNDYLKPHYFDCLIFADVLEHLKDPWCVLKNSLKFLGDEGVVIASIPNIRHYTTLFNLLFQGNWPYRERGIHDRTHLRFFTLKNIRKLFQEANLEIVLLERSYRLIERPHRYNRFSRYLAFPLFKEFLAFSYLIVAKKQKKKLGRKK